MLLLERDGERRIKSTGYFLSVFISQNRGA